MYGIISTQDNYFLNHYSNNERQVLITGVSSDYNPNFGKGWYDNFFKKIPKGEIKDAAKFNKIGSALASPHWNRLALGVAAITTQPAIDFFNPKVDRDTAKAASIRTVSKILVCTAVGFAVRGSCYKLTNKLIGDVSKIETKKFIPMEIREETNKELQEQKLKLFKNTKSTLLALAVMVFTNFYIDAPGTTKLANYWLAKANLNHQKKKEDAQNA